MNEQLLRESSAEEVKKALFSIGDMKAPGVDGLHAIFFKKCWHILGDAITAEVLDAINNKTVPLGWNDTVIVLISKVQNPELVTQPISLCNVLYKVISKMIASRLKLVLDDVILPGQSAFVPGRLITNNVLLAYESLHTIKNKKKGKWGYCAVKFDMHKAYDRVEWNFLENMMMRLGFHGDFVTLLMGCVRFVRYKVRFNNQETESFLPSRGLRQGDPLSPYLFLLCAEALSSLLAHREEVRGMEGVRVCRNAPSVSHLLFADDSLILMKANMTNATSLRQVLDQYCASSGQLVSEAKCSIFFSPNVDPGVRADVCTELNIMTEAISDKYLGLPAVVRADRSDSFVYLLERIIKRLESWKEKFLSMGGKEILLKAVIQSFPVYAMSIFKIPKSLCKQMTDAIAGFWWGDTETQIRMHWMAWWKLCIPKRNGGMGFRDPHAFNLAMLAKQTWRLLSNPDSVCAQVLRAKYYPEGNLLKAGPKKGSSFTWQSIIAGLATFRRGHIWRVGYGQHIRIWEDHWIPGSLDRMIQTPKGGSLLRTVDELINLNTFSWNEEKIRENFNPIDVNRILCIPLNENFTEDFVAWHGTKTHSFSVRSAYYIEWNHIYGQRLTRNDIPGPSSVNPVWETLWKLKVPSKIKIFGWKALHGIIPSMAVLANRHIPVSAQCSICLQGPEDVKHLMFTCERAMEVWKSLGLETLIRSFLVDRSGSIILEELLRANFQNNDQADLTNIGLKELILIGAWYVWWQRREAVKGEKIANPSHTAFSIQALAINYQGASSGREQREVRWSRPPPHTYKLNIDASFYPNGSGATGAVLRDSKGVAVAGSADVAGFLLDATTAEAPALQKGLQMIERLGCVLVVIESDSLELVQAYNGAIEIWSPYTAILADCFQIARRIGQVSVQHCLREANAVAHALARHFYVMNSAVFWDGDPPSFINPYVINDVSLFELK